MLKMYISHGRCHSSITAIAESEDKARSYMSANDPYGIYEVDSYIECVEIKEGNVTFDFGDI